MGRIQKLVTFKMEEKQLHDLDRSVKSLGYNGRTEFLRQAIREHVHREKLKQKLLEDLKSYYSKPKKHLSAKEYRKHREESARAVAKKFNIDLDESLL